MTNDERRDEQKFTATQQAAFLVLDAFRDFADSLEGAVAHYRGNGWTDDQARAIVAFQLGWRPTNGSTPEGAT